MKNTIKFRGVKKKGNTFGGSKTDKTNERGED